MKENSTLNRRSTSTTSPIEGYRCFTLKYLPWVRPRTEEFEVHAGSPWPEFERTWLQVLNYTRPWVLNYTRPWVSIFGSKEIRREEFERCKCTDKRRKKKKYFGQQKKHSDSSPRALFSDDVAERDWGQQTLRGSLLCRLPDAQMKSRRTTTVKEVKGSTGSYRTLSAELHRQRLQQTVSWIFSVLFFNQYGTDLVSKQPSCFYGKQFPQMSSHV